MKPALLDSIYNKINSDDEKTGLKDLSAAYCKKVLMKYLHLLDKASVTNLKEKVNIKLKFSTGKTYEDKRFASEYILETLLFSEEFEDEIAPLDEKFLKDCPCNNKEEYLDYLKYSIADIGWESIDIKDWMKIAEKFDSCESVAEIIKENDDEE